MVWPLIVGAIEAAGPIIVLPFAMAVGAIGYAAERAIRGDKETPWKTKSIEEERDERHLAETENKDMTNVESLKAKTFVPKTIFERNK